MSHPKTSDQLILLSKILDRTAKNKDTIIKYCKTVNDIGENPVSGKRVCISLGLGEEDCNVCPLRTTKHLEETIKTLQVLGE